MPTKEQLASMTKLLGRIDHLRQSVNSDNDLVHKGERMLFAELLADLAVQVKQLQLEVAKLELPH